MRLNNTCFRWISCAGALALLLVLAGCGGNVATPQPLQTLTPTVAPIGWDTKPGAILFRIDRQVIGESAIDAMNRLPYCTIYGDGYIVWVNPAPPLGEEVFEARLTQPTIRSFLDYIIREQQFYSIPDYAARQLPPPGKHTIDSLLLRINNETRTVRSYNTWSRNEYNTLLDRCTHLSSEPVVYLPAGAWVNAQPIAGSQDPTISWVITGGFRLGELAASGKPIWISGPSLTFIWQTLHRTQGGIQWLENDKNYQLGLQAPGVSREAPPAPQVTPTMPVVVLTGTATTIPTATPGPGNQVVTATPPGATAIPPGPTGKP